MKMRTRRSAFTLLEVLLASLIAILLLAALYFAMDMTLRQTAESRDAVDVDNLSRGVFTRVNIDLSGSLGPLPPKSGGNAASSTPAPAATADPSMMTTADPSAAATAAAPAATADPTAPTAPMVDPTTGEVAASPQAADLGFQGGVIGTDKQLTVFVSRLPVTLTSAKGLTETPGSQLPSDLYRITYWLGQNGGLCRQERPWVTADGVRNSADPDLSDEAGDTLVQEVTDVTFEYFDPRENRGWVPSWDGTEMSDDTVTPIGPPRAVRVKLTFSIPASRPGNQPLEHTVEQVIPIRTAPGPNTPTMLTPSTDPGTTSSDPAAATGTGAATSSGGAATGGGAATSGAAGGGGATGGTRTGGGGGATPAAPSTGGGGGAKSGGTAPSTGGAKGGR